MRPVLVFENYSPDSFSTLDEIAADFETDHWITTSCDGASVTLLHNNTTVKLSRQHTPHAALDFYENLLSKLPAVTPVIRVRNPFPPSHPLIWKEISEQFPDNRFDYVLSTADECGFHGYFVERFNQKALTGIRKNGSPYLMPPGYFNGMILESAGRHWHSLELHNYYFREHFNDLYDSPRCVAINAIPGCNYRCNKCQYHSPRRTHGKDYSGNLMPVTVFQEMLTRCKEFGKLTSIVPTISGEPLIHPEIVTIVSMIKKAGYGCGFATNAALLTEEMSRKLLEVGVDGLAFSVDSIDPETYRKLQGGDLAQVERNILEFKSETIRQRGSFSGSVVCVVSKENEHEIEEYRRIWLDRGFTVVFSAEHDFANGYQPYFSNLEWGPKQRIPCACLWSGLYLNANGTPVACGSMAQIDGLHESILEMPVGEVWRGKTLQFMRNEQFADVPPNTCQNCTCWTGQMTTWINKNGRLICHTQGSWLEQPPTVPATTESLQAPLPWYKRALANLLRK